MPQGILSIDVPIVVFLIIKMVTKLVFFPHLQGNIVYKQNPVYWTHNTPLEVGLHGLGQSVPCLQEQ